MSVTYGFIGAGHISREVAAGLAALGHRVIISNSRGPETLGEIARALGSTVSAATVDDTAEQADVVFAGIPMSAYTTLPVAALAGKVVIDALNYYPPRDGHIMGLSESECATSELVQAHLGGARVAKGFNHIAAAEVSTTARPAGHPERRALATASDDPAAAALVGDLYDLLGFDVVNLGPLSESRGVEYGRPAFLENLSLEALREMAVVPR